ncbi:MAG: hypothetical protein NVSMB19_24450 [Vulcanimicrobiaceae bacterium]
MTDDSLLHLLRAPAFVESTVRAALAETIAVRRESGGEPDVRAFTMLALRRAADTRVAGGDALTQHEFEAAVVRAAAFFAASPLGRRLRSMPVERIVRAPRGVDAAVVDRGRGLHYIRLETYIGTQARLDAVTRAVAAMDRRPLGARASLHFFSLRDGEFRSYPAAPARGRSSTVGRAA